MPVVGRNLFLVRKNLLPEALASKMGLEYLHLGQIDEGKEAWAKRCRELVDSERNLMVAGFEHRIFDPASNSRKMELLARLLELRERSVIVLSQVSPARLFATEPADNPWLLAANESPPPYDEWRSLLSAFTVNGTVPGTQCYPAFRNVTLSFPNLCCCPDDFITGFTNACGCLRVSVLIILLASLRPTAFHS